MPWMGIRASLLAAIRRLCFQVRLNLTKKIHAKGMKADYPLLCGLKVNSYSKRLKS